MRQATVLCWAGLETLASDVFIALVNAKPDMAGVLFRDPRTKRYYQGRDLALALEEHNYNLSLCMGEVLVDQHRIDDVEGMRNIFDVLFPSSDSLRHALSEEKLWRLSQDRNLIVHRRGTIDRQYVAKTGSKLPLGTRLRVHPDSLEEYFQYSRTVAIEILKALS